MKSLNYFMILYLLTILGIGCKDSNEPKKMKVDPFESALPHGQSPENPLKLTSTDLDNLGNAKGKTIEMISTEALFEKIDHSANALHLYYFWSANDLVSKNMLRNLSTVQKEFTRKKVKIYLINFDDKVAEHELNKVIRLFPHNDGYYRVPAEQKTDMLRIIYNKWNGKVPGLLVVNKTNRTKSYLSNEINSNELYAILQPLAL